MKIFMRSLILIMATVTLITTACSTSTDPTVTEKTVNQNYWGTWYLDDGSNLDDNHYIDITYNSITVFDLPNSVNYEAYTTGTDLYVKKNGTFEKFGIFSSSVNKLATIDGKVYMPKASPREPPVTTGLIGDWILAGQFGFKIYSFPDGIHLDTYIYNGGFTPQQPYICIYNQNLNTMELKDTTDKTLIILTAILSGSNLNVTNVNYIGLDTDYLYNRIIPTGNYVKGTINY